MWTRSPIAGLADLLRSARIHHGSVSPCIPALGIEHPKHFILALVTHCSTAGKDATQELTTYESTTTSITIDIRMIECVVGCVRRGNGWGIVDRSGDFACTVFMDPRDDEDP
jgi:hypothetical protein